MIKIGAISTTISEVISQGDFSKIAVLVDEHTKKHCYPNLKIHLPKHTLIQIPSGETQKHLQTAEKIWEALTTAAFDRHGLLINLGGGVIGDMGGFCAATYKRGISFVQVPTTLLAQVDASVGGKLGIDFQGFKNHIGVFKVPNAVLIDPAFLQTLPTRELRSGFAEVIKHCLIADASRWEVIKKLDLHEQDWASLISHSVGIKEAITLADPTEKNIRKTLNFGHTLGHAVETYFLEDPKKRLLHGEAIAVGILTEAFISYKRNLLKISELEQIESFVFSIFGKTEIQSSDFESIISLTLQDKKNKNGQVRFALLNGIGSCVFDQAVTPKEMHAALSYYLG